MKIPILNLYYMLSYSWNCLDEEGILKVNHSDFNSLKQLFSKIISNGCTHLIKRGLDRSYILVSEEYRGIKGKFNIHESVGRLLHKQGKAVCEYDELDYNIIHNQIIKATIHILLRDKELDLAIHSELKKLYQNFHKVDLIQLNQSVFRKVNIHKNIRHYDLLLRVCKFIYDNSTLNENSGTLVFTDFIRDDKKMAVLFQSFVRNFYKSEQSKFKVKGEDIYWAFMPIGNSDMSFLPKMQTDITLENVISKVIIDTKYYSKTLANNYKETFHSHNLYQLFSYLINQEEKSKDSKFLTCTGILLYPQVDKELNEHYMYKEHRITVKTINLDSAWQNIKKELLNLLDNV